MAIEWADNFQNYGTGEPSRALLVNGAYAEAGGTTGACIVTEDPDPNVTTNVMNIGKGDAGGGVLHTLRKVLNSSQSVVGISGRYWCSILPPTSSTRPSLAEFADVSNNVLVSVFVLPTGAIRVTRGSSGGGVVLGDTPGPVLVANAWQHVEVKCTLDSTTGAIEVRVEGLTVLSLSGINTSVSDLPCAQVSFRMTRSGTDADLDYFIKDLVVWNTLGAYNTDFLGSASVFTIVPDSDVALNWTPTGAANGWSILDNGPPNDAQFISAGVGPIPSAYQATLTDLPADVTSVKGLVSIVRARKTDGGDGTLQVGIESGMSVDLGADRPITPAFTYWADVSEENPATTSPWTPAAVNAAGLRINRTT